MILGGMTVACCNIATVNMTMAVGERTTIISICHSFGKKYGVKRKIVSLQENDRKRKNVTKIWFTPLPDFNILPSLQYFTLIFSIWHLTLIIFRYKSLRQRLQSKDFLKGFKKYIIRSLWTKDQTSSSFQQAQYFSIFQQAQQNAQVQPAQAQANQQLVIGNQSTIQLTVRT